LFLLFFALFFVKGLSSLCIGLATFIKRDESLFFKNRVIWNPQFLGRGCVIQMADNENCGENIQLFESEEITSVVETLPCYIYLLFSISL
jgi:hypothetical protein